MGFYIQVDSHLPSKDLPVQSSNGNTKKGVRYVQS